MEQKIFGYENKRTHNPNQNKKDRAQDQRGETYEVRTSVRKRGRPSKADYGKQLEWVTEIPPGLSDKSWRLQVYDWLLECSEKMGTYPIKLLCDAHGSRDKRWNKFVVAMRRDDPKYKFLVPKEICVITRKTGIPLIIY